MKEKLGRTVKEACELLTSEGFEVWAHEPRSVRVSADVSKDDVYKFIRSPRTLHRRYNEAESYFELQNAKKDLDQDVLELVERRKGQTPKLD